MRRRPRARLRPRLRVIVAPVALASLVLAGCTLLVSFDDQPDAGADPDSFPGRLDGEAGDGQAPGDAPIGDGGVDVFSLGSCQGQINGQYCGNNQLDGYPNPDDLVTCDAGKIVAVKPCTTGAQCLHLKDPHPDQCDQCSGKTDGLYCGRQFTGWSDANANVQVQCQAGGEVSVRVCTSTCTNGSTTACP